MGLTAIQAGGSSLVKMPQGPDGMGMKAGSFIYDSSISVRNRRSNRDWPGFDLDQPLGKHCTLKSLISHRLFFRFKKKKMVRKTANGKKIDRPNLKKTISRNRTSYVLTLKRMPPKI
jgi:hypothetical protein